MNKSKSFKAHFGFSFFKKIIYLFLERGEREREGNIIVWLPLACPLLVTWHITQACALIGNQTGNPLVHRPALNLLSYTSQGSLWFLLMMKLVSPVPESCSGSESETVRYL